MENLEEVLQALDEFQKMRPTEIPRELEDYLCWVAKTGDPVYQWSMIKTLFREKLTRVMTDFYESCPTLELAPCPNVEHFNYDTMKNNLLERLESFANAPFTVQRICELLTAPRKEYNRVDKFMRAIEKNILVVSTREPGPIARRSENGDSMVNGSVDDAAPVTQPPQDVEMEYWEKDCTSTVTISVHTVENETSLLQTVIPSATVVKSVFGTDENQEKDTLSSSRSEGGVVSNFIETSSEFSSVTNLTSQVQGQDSTANSGMQNLSTITTEASSGIVNDVPEAIMNEDTSSQPSLDLEGEDSDVTDSTKKLQTTFQAKDFSLGDSKIPKFCLDDSKVMKDKINSGGTLVMDTDDEQTNPMTTEEIKTSSSELKTVITTDNNTAISNTMVVEEKMTKTDDIDDKDDEKLHSKSDITDAEDNVHRNIQSIDGRKVLTLDNNKSIDNSSSIDDSEEIRCTSVKSYELETDVTTTSDETNTSLMTSNTMVSGMLQQNIEDSKEIPMDTSTNEMLDTEEEHAKQNTEEATELTTEDVKPVIEDPDTKSSDSTENINNSNNDKSGVTIVEALEDDNKVMKSIVPDPIPIIEEPKDPEPQSRKLDDLSTTPVEIEEIKNDASNINCQSSPSIIKDKFISNKNHDLEDIEDSTTVCKNECESMELMDVDDDESLSMFQGEPMEQETIELAKS
ncbi:PREDICTED: serine/threonine-protein phosphatase 4 regulatory subunit 2-like isoform X1 [Polistes dominula]|uniref:Serine/threonine-protein phosphatase 4 regulatory subunit 2-like isoform X1 n=1 Tax=Polistes dominula TaxID=743375 RepID=A0ABM1IU91_POLDO|nr:PREDICTED: serine/threonine-protein phosphatase 4 regulatory subunit 2-like isoform X1 [Polistes dominula]